MGVTKIMPAASSCNDQCAQECKDALAEVVETIDGSCCDVAMNYDGAPPSKLECEAYVVGAYKDDIQHLIDTNCAALGPGLAATLRLPTAHASSHVSSKAKQTGTIFAPGIVAALVGAAFGITVVGFAMHRRSIQVEPLLG